MNEDTPRVNKATVHAGGGYDTYGKQRDGSFYCKIDEARKLERELNAANASVTALIRASTRALNVLKAQGESVRSGNVLGALTDAIKAAKGGSAS